MKTLRRVKWEQIGNIFWLIYWRGYMRMPSALALVELQTAHGLKLLNIFQLTSEPAEVCMSRMFSFQVADSIIK